LIVDIDIYLCYARTSIHSYSTKDGHSEKLQYSEDVDSPRIGEHQEKDTFYHED
jgi:hypothetical protein